MITGKKLNHILRTGAAHALYRKDGKWYHHLIEFPGILFDSNGYLAFQSRDEYLRCPQLKHGEELHVDGGISSIEGYKNYTSDEMILISQIT